MKIFGVDLSAKWITFEMHGKEYTVHFKDSLIKGIHSIEVYEIACDGYSIGGRVDAKIRNAYPPLRKIIYEMVRIWFPIWISKLKSRQHNNQ